MKQGNLLFCCKKSPVTQRKFENVQEKTEHSKVLLKIWPSMLYNTRTQEENRFEVVHKLQNTYNFYIQNNDCQIKSVWVFYKSRKSK